MNILHLPIGATSEPTMIGNPVASPHKPTSCEGYVTKRGHFRKSWRVRYLVLNGADLQVSYYDSKEHARNEPMEPKGSFYLSSVEKHEYCIGVIGAKEKPFGFKMVGHAPKRGYMELDIFVETLADLNKWLEVCQNALEASKKLTRNGQADSNGSKTLFGLALTSSPQQQMKKLVTTKEDMLKQAIQEIESAKLIGQEACQEMVVQGEQLDHIDNELSQVQSELDYADKLLKHMASPNLHMFSTDHRTKAKSTAPSPVKTSTPPSPARTAVLGSPSTVEAVSTFQPEMNEIERLAKLLGDLEQQATLLNEETIKSTGQIDHISDQLSTVNDRVQAQTKKANTTIRNA